MTGSIHIFTVKQFISGNTFAISENRFFSVSFIIYLANDICLGVSIQAKLIIFHAVFKVHLVLKS